MASEANVEELAAFIHSHLAKELMLPRWEEVPDRHKPTMRSLARRLLEDPPACLKTTKGTL